ncbi:MAG: protease inhibitor I9 family protein, partial [Egibacteraceae bacterium]
MTRYLALIGTATMVVALLPATGGSAGAERPEDPGAIPGSYIVVLAEGAEHPRTVAAEHSQAHDAVVTHVYGTALRGYAARMSDQAVARVAGDPRVAYVDVDRVVTTAHHQCGHTARGKDGPCDDAEPDPPEARQPVPWGVERIGAPV